MRTILPLLALLAVLPGCSDNPLPAPRDGCYQHGIEVLCPPYPVQFASLELPVLAATTDAAPAPAPDDAPAISPEETVKAFASKAWPLAVMGLIYWLTRLLRPILPSKPWVVWVVRIQGIVAGGIAGWATGEWLFALLAGVFAALAASGWFSQGNVLRETKAGK